MDNPDLFEPSNLLYTQERMRGYRQGGFHPVSLGDTFKDGRYMVHHKLGWGGFSTVWLVRDQLYVGLDSTDRPCADVASFVPDLIDGFP